MLRQRDIPHSAYHTLFTDQAGRVTYMHLTHTRNWHRLTNPGR